MSEMTEDKTNEICRSIALRANEFIDTEVHKNFEEYDDQVAADVTVKLILIDATLKAFKKVSGVEYAKIVRCIPIGQDD